VLSAADDIELLGPRSQAELRELFAKASTYVATSRYEPFGLSPLEAALSRCALVMNDNPVFHELWGDAAIYFASNDPDDLSRVLRELEAKPRLREEFAQRGYKTACIRFTAQRMVEQYEKIYQNVCSTAGVA
jgi:glycosyltransferase involved in cell wall biosynthesis